MNRLFLILIAMVAVFSPALGQTRAEKSKGDVRKAIESSTQKFVEVFSKGDAAGIAAMYADGAKVMPPQSPVVQGRQPIQALWQGLIDTGAKISLSTTDVESRGDLAVEVGTYKLTFRDGKVDSGKFIVVWKQEKGQWKLLADIWNSDLPIPGQ
jgi:ketosteroid isomerase-like protein